MLMGTTRKRKRRKPHPSAAKRLPPSPPGEGVGERKVFDVWYTPTIRDVYAQLKVAEQMLSRIPDQELAVVKREMYLLEDMMYQFVGGVTGMKVKGWMDQVDIAWVKAVEKKLGLMR